MIAGVKGVVVEKYENSLVLETSLFRLQIFVSQGVMHSCEINTEMFFHTYLHVREDDLSLFGLQTKDQLLLFRKLISVSGIGPKMALEMLSVGEYAVYRAITQGDTAFLCTLKGVGKKTAERIVLELREKLGDIQQQSVQEGRSKDILEREGACLALEKLGFQKGEIFQNLKHLPQNIVMAEEIVQWFLKNSSRS
jgi:Holliday junction DNA helicase RuvA